MLRYRMIVSRFNKLSLLLAAGLLVTTGIVRFGDAGKFCSGDHLSAEERSNPEFTRKFAIAHGNAFHTLITASLVVVALAAVAAGVLGVAAWMAFK